MGRGGHGVGGGKSVDREVRKWGGVGEGMRKWVECGY